MRKQSDSISIDAARRIAIRAQSLHNSQSQQSKSRSAVCSSDDTDAGLPKVSQRAISRCIETMGVLQIDAINTIIRSHYLPLFSRLGHYDTAQLDRLVFDASAQSSKRRRFFEYWGHECSLIPLQDYPLLRWRMDDARRDIGIYKQLGAIAKSKPAYVREIRGIVEREGPISSRSIEGAKRGPGMWEWSHSKQALEYLFWTGEITTRGRSGFARLYDLTERSIPAQLLEQKLSREDAQALLLEKSLGALGVATAADIRDYYRLSAVDADHGLQRLVEEGRIRPIGVEDWKQTAYCLPDVVVPRQVSATTLLTPFDPLVWCRQRLLRLFDFDYRIEIYVPRDKRRFGYYVLPFLQGDKIVARVDLKAERKDSTLQVLGAWLEPGADKNSTAASLAMALAQLAQWLQLSRITLSRRGNLAVALKKEVQCAEM